MRSSALLHWSSALFVSQAVCQKLIFDKKRRTKRPGKSHRAPVSCFSLLIYFFEPHVARLAFHPRVARASTDTLRSLRTRSRGLPTVRKNVNEATKRHRWFTKWFETSPKSKPENASYATGSGAKICLRTKLQPDHI